eukprot:COSAG06_NODE_640_length_13515_cov_6.190206_10_plen_113_part_00
MRACLLFPLPAYQPGLILAVSIWVITRKRFEYCTGEQRLAAEVGAMRSQGLHDEDILDAKIGAVYTWADAITGDGLGPAEIMRLADEISIRWGTTVVRSRDRRSVSYLVPQR